MAGTSAAYTFRGDELFVRAVEVSSRPHPNPYEEGYPATACLQPFGLHEGLPTGFRGRFPQPLEVEELIRRCEEIYARKPQIFGRGPDPVRTLGIISGGAVKEFWQAIDQGLDAYITGEVSEWVMNVARETQTHFLAAGHYATERLGVKALGKKIEADYGIEVEYVDVPNPV